MSTALDDLLHARTGPMTADMVQHPAKFGLGRVPARLQPSATTTSICGFCSTGCSLKIHLNAEGEAINLPIAHGEGRYQCDADQLQQLEGEGRVVLRYGQNPNGSVGDVAGLTNQAGNVLGLMPHPERVFRTVTNSWHPDDWGQWGPWMRLFRNARHWLG